MDEGLKVFLQESNENLEKMEHDLLALSTAPTNRELVKRVFRYVHTMKGMCGFLDLVRLEKISHHAEELLANLRDGKLPVTPLTIQRLLRVRDAVRRILADLEATEKEPAGDDAPLMAEIQDSLQGEPARTDESPVSEVLIPVAEPAHDGAPARAEVHALRVDVRVLDLLMSRTEELVLVRNRLAQLAQGERGAAYRSSIQELDRVTAELQEVVTRTRMQDIGHAWRRLPRILHDLLKDSGKKIDLSMTGGETQVDRQVLDGIEEPFVHMLRNSADHGIEPPEVRRSRGKPERGTITIRAVQEGGNILVEIGDDGAGVDVDAIRRKLVATERMSEVRAQGLSDDECMQYLFESGFTTASKVTSVSGRGVGMDAVRAKIEAIGGSIGIRSRRGAGTTIHIRIPLTLAISSALIVKCGGRVFAIPQTNVLELVRIHAGNHHIVEELHDSRVLHLRDRLLTLVRLDQVLGLPVMACEEECIAVVEADGKQFGLVVTGVLNTEEIVVKPVGRLIAHLPVYAGTTILGDGSIIMILDPSGIAARARLGDEQTAQVATSDAPAPSQLVERYAESLVLFEGAPGSRLAVPLALVSRLEVVPLARIERPGDRAVLQYRGGLMPLVPFDGFATGTVDPQPLIVLSDGVQSAGIMVSRIHDIVEVAERLPLIPGTGETVSMVVDGRATDLVDVGVYLARSGSGLRSDPGSFPGAVAVASPAMASPAVAMHATAFAHGGGRP